MDREALEHIKKLGIQVVERNEYAEIEADVVGAVIKDAQTQSDSDGKRIVIIDVGGYFAKPLVGADTRHIAGIVEDTTFGHNRYKTLADKIAVPLLSVARSELKEIEARFVGKDAVVAMDLMLRGIGVSISGRNALVIGYGMIGKNVARTLRRYDLKVYVYDTKDTRNLKAHTDGFGVERKHVLLPKADIIFSATGSEAISGAPALSYKEIEDSCKDNVVLASVGSRKSEFEMQKLKSMATKKRSMGEGLTSYTLTKNKEVVVARDGSAVNFSISSIPVEILDLVFSEIAVCAIRLLGPKHGLAIGIINELSGDFLHSIANDWIRLSNEL